MIFDSLKNHCLYSSLGPEFVRAFSFLQASQSNPPADGTYQLDNENLFAVVRTYAPKKQSPALWEAHFKYIDLQYVLSGSELIGYGDVSNFKVESESIEKDLTRLSGNGLMVPITVGDFMILWPHEAHLPGISDGVCEEVKKIVVKIDKKYFSGRDYGIL